MGAYLIKRLLLVVPTLLGISAITFLLLQAIPGDPALGLVGERASPEVVAEIRRALGTERPVWEQYVGYMGLLVRGELGRSLYTQRPVARDLLEKFPNTLRLALAAMVFATLSGLALGIITAVWRGTWVDRLGSVFAIGGISVPVFWLGLMLMWVFAVFLQWLPPAGMGHGQLAYLVLPAATLGIYSMGSIARITRSSVLEVASQPYVASARARGLGPWRVVGRHVLRNALIPIMTLIGVDFGSYLNGAVLTESIFGWDGIGRYALEGIIRRDYPVILGTVLFGAAVFVAVNAAVDLFYGVADPRIRHGWRGGRVSRSA